jgi:hypothetical protein
MDDRSDSAYRMRMAPETPDDANSESAVPQAIDDTDAPPQGLERAAEPDAPASGTLFDQVRRLHPSAKFRLALKADQTTRAILLTDNDPRTLFFLCQNPHVTAPEILRICKDTRLPLNAIDYLVRSAQWIGREEIKHALVTNPKTPMPTALRLLPLLERHHLRTIAKSQTVRQRIKHAALKLVIDSPR